MKMYHRIMRTFFQKMNRHGEDEACVLWCGGLDDKVTQELLYELMMQAGPVEKVTKPKDKNFAFVLFKVRMAKNSLKPCFKA